MVTVRVTAVSPTGEEATLFPRQANGAPIAAAVTINSRRELTTTSYCLARYATLQAASQSPRLQLHMTAIRSIVSVVTLVLSAAAAASAQTTALRFARLVDGVGHVLADAVVVVQGERITSVGTGATAVPNGARVIDLRPLTAIPGLIDVHTHMTYYWDQRPGTQPWSQQGRRRSAETVFLAQENARKTLETGVTTVRDLGASEYGDIVMRDLIERGAMVGPRMFVAGFGLSRQRTPPRPGAPPGPPRGRISEIADIPVAVKAQVEIGRAHV